MTAPRSTITMRRPRRGMAMMLVLISLFTATIITTAYLASRDNSALVGANVASATAARWSAMSGLDLGVAILETERDWRTGHNGGRLLEDYALANALVDLEVVDIETEAPPTAATRHVQLTATAHVGGVSQSATAVASVAPIDGDPDIDLSEFAVFARDRLTLAEDAILARWGTSPLARLGHPVNVGTRAVAAGAIGVQSNAAAVDATVYHGPGASGTLVSNATTLSLPQVALLDQIPMPAAPAPPVAASAPDDGDLVVDDELELTDDRRYARIETSSAASMITISGDHTLVVEDDLRLAAGSGVRIDGAVTLVVMDELRLEAGSFIELETGASLTLHLGGDLRLEDAYVGERRADASVRDISGEAPWIDPGRIRLFGGTSGTPNWTLELNSVVKGALYAPLANLTIRNESALYGCAAAMEVRIEGSSALFYDHTLDSSLGYTNPKSPVFDEAGRIVQEVLDVVSLSDAPSLSDVLGDLLGGGDDEPAAGEPTPRPVPVAYEITAFGADSSAWEARAQ